MSKPEKTIDLTPTWVAAVRIYMAVLEDGNEEGRRAAREDLTILAQKMDAFNKVNWAMVTEAAQVRGQQWRQAFNDETPENVVNEMWEAGQLEREDMAVLIESAVADAWKFLKREIK